MLEVDGVGSKRITKLHETLIVPNSNVNLSHERVVKTEFLPMYGEVEGKCIIKKRNDGGG